MSLHRVGFNITLKCTLKCRLCGAGVPYIEGDVPHYTLQAFMNDVATYFSVVDYVDVFNITGGEPFIHKDLANMLVFLQKYRDKIGRLEIYTNGTVFISEEMAECLKETKCKVVVDDYGDNISTKVQDILGVLQKCEVEHEHRLYCNDKDGGVYCGGWVNLLDIAKLPRSDDEAESYFSRCINANEVRCNNIIDGKMYICSFHYYCIMKGVIPDDAAYYADVRNNSLEELKHQVEHLSKLDYLPACRYCNGFFHDSQRYIPAEQL